MFSRFWYFVLAAVAAAAMAAAYLVQATTHRSSEQSLDEALRRDRFEVELWMSLDDHARIDAIGPMTTNADVKAVITEANARAANAAVPAGSKQHLEATLTQLNRQLAEGAADILVALDHTGAIVAQIGGGAVPANATLHDLDFVASALGGDAKSAIWMRDGQPLRAAARPVFSGGSVIGVIVHAMTIDDDLARRLAEHVAGSSIGFFHGSHIVASASAEGAQSTDRASMQGSLEAARTNPELRTNGRTGLVELPTGAKSIYALFPGQPADGALGFVVARPSTTTSSPFGTLASAPSQDVAGLPWPAILGVPLLCAVLGIVILMFEREKPLTAFVAEVRRIADGTAQKVASASLKGQFRILAEDINAGLERAGASADASARKSQSLDHLLGSTAPSAAPAFFPPQQAAPAPEPKRASAPAEMPITSPPPAARAPAPPAPAPAAPPPPAPVPVASQAISMPPGADMDDDDDGATTVAQIPAELLSALHQDNQEEDRHFRETYDEYIRIREQCGEPTKGLTFEKFVGTLRKTKDQIVAKHGSSKVRFTVYIKEGKAALKASPR